LARAAFTTGGGSRLTNRLHDPHHRIDDREVMAGDGADTGDSPVTREQWRALRRIRRLRLISQCSWVTYGLWLASLVPIIQLELIGPGLITRQTTISHIEFVLIGALIATAATACEGIVGVVLQHSLCPRCHHEFFDPHHSRRHAEMREVANGSILPQPFGSHPPERCCNCELSLGLAATPEPHDPAAPRA
jgi:hypothetical protein